MGIAGVSIFFVILGLFSIIGAPVLSAVFFIIAALVGGCATFFRNAFFFEREEGNRVYYTQSNWR